VEQDILRINACEITTSSHDRRSRPSKSGSVSYGLNWRRRGMPSLTSQDRINRRGEALLAVRVNRTLAGIGNLTVDPVVPNALRAAFLRPVRLSGGVGRELVLSYWRAAVEPSG
jgi:hypothetical protein